MKAIIIVDMQEDFADHGPFTLTGVLEIDQMIPTFIEKIRKDKAQWKVIFSMDYHPHNHVSFSTFPRHCVRGTLGANLLPNCNLVEKDLLIKKGTKKNIENFSAYYNGKRKTKLEKLLKKNNITEVYLAGVLGEICVKATYLDLVKENFNPVIIDELTFFKDEALKKDLKFISMNDVLK